MCVCVRQFACDSRRQSHIPISMKQRHDYPCRSLLGQIFTCNEEKEYERKIRIKLNSAICAHIFVMRKTREKKKKMAKTWIVCYLLRRSFFSCFFFFIVFMMLFFAWLHLCLAKQPKLCTLLAALCSALNFSFWVQCTLVLFSLPLRLFPPAPSAS